MKEIKAYQCAHCGYYKKTKKSVIEHEDRCFHDHKHRACQTCKRNIMVDYDINDLQFDESIYTRVNSHYCAAENKFLDDFRKDYKNNCELWVSK